MKSFAIGCCAAALVLLTGCATTQKPIDYSAFARAKPVTLLVLPPVSEAPDINATPATWASATLPLAEAGYYVLPATLVDETFKQNGVVAADEAQAVPYQKLRSVFGADAAVYIKVKRYGTTYQIIASETVVEVEARIVDLRDGALLWEGKASASSAEQRQQSQGLAGILISAVINQIIGTATDAAYNYSVIADQRAFSTVLPGPRSAKAGQVPTPAAR